MIRWGFCIFYFIFIIFLFLFEAWFLNPVPIELEKAKLSGKERVG